MSHVHFKSIACLAWHAVSRRARASLLSFVFSPSLSRLCALRVPCPGKHCRRVSFVSSLSPLPCLVCLLPVSARLSRLSPPCLRSRVSSLSPPCLVAVSRLSDSVWWRVCIYALVSVSGLFALSRVWLALSRVCRDCSLKLLRCCLACLPCCLLCEPDSLLCARTHTHIHTHAHTHPGGFSSRHPAPLLLVRGRAYEGVEPSFSKLVSITKRNRPTGDG
jgi:hypothetical protein